MLQAPIYLLCAATALACSILLLRGFRRTGVRLLLWCGLCFLALTLENLFLIVDFVLTGPETDLSALHISSALAGVALLLYGLIFEAK